MPSALSPIKSKRMEEKASLQSLNSRLETYVFHMKEMEDAKLQAERELETIRERMTKEMAALRHRLTTELEETRQKLDHEETQRASIQKLEQEQNEELKKLRVQVQELKETKELCTHLRNELDKEKQNCASAKQQLQEQSTLLQCCQREFKELKREHRSNLATLQDTLKELQHYKSKADEVDSMRDQEIAKIRKEMAAKMQEMAAQHKKDHEESVAAIEKENRAYYERVVANLNSQIEDLSSELDVTKKELERTATDYEESLVVRQQLTDKVVKLEREYREDRSKFTDQRRVLEANLEKMRELNVRKEREFNELMDVKIALDQEISAYHRILDREETRVGLPTPKTTPQGKASGGSRKRSAESVTNQLYNGLGSLLGTQPAKKQRKGTKKLKRTSLDKDVDGGVRIALLDLEKERIVLENTSDREIPLKGWQVCGREAHQKFAFPESYAMKPRAKATVLYGKKHTKDELKGGKDGDLFWTKKCSWDPKGDWVVLTNAEGVPVSTLAEGLSPEEVQALEEDLVDDVDDNNAETCIVM